MIKLENQIFIHVNSLHYYLSYILLGHENIKLSVITSQDTVISFYFSSQGLAPLLNVTIWLFKIDRFFVLYEISILGTCEFYAFKSPLIE